MIKTVKTVKSAHYGQNGIIWSIYS